MMSMILGSKLVKRRQSMKAGNINMTKLSWSAKAILKASMQRVVSHMVAMVMVAKL